MDAETLRKRLAAGEDDRTEFKARANDTELVEAVVCLANGRGGLLLVGVDDDGRVVGAEPRHGEVTDPDRLSALVANSTDPAVVVDAEVVPHGDAEVIALHVPSSSTVVGTTSGRFVRRAVGVNGEPQCLPMRAHEVLARAGSTGERDHSAVPLPGLTVDDLSRVELDRYRRLSGADGDRVLGGLSDTDLLQALGMVTLDGELTIGAVLLFADPEVLIRAVPTHEVEFQVLERLQVRVNEADRTPLLRAMTELDERIRAHNPEEEVEVGLFRVGLPRFAEVAIRELLANALVHRDYTRLGTVQVRIDEESLEVANPGGFPEGITTANLLTAPPRPRNPLLADAFKRAGLVERTGRGINRVFESQLALGRPAPDYGRSTDAFVVARLRAGPADRELAGYLDECRRAGQQFSLEDLLVLHEVRQERRITTARAAELFQVPAEEARTVLNRLVERGLLEARGESKGRTYHLAAAVYRRLGQATEYVRTRGFDSLQQEQMVLTFVRRHGAITRREAADLCQLEPGQAGRLLRRLRDDGRLEQVGTRRAARYVLPGGTG